MTLGKENHVVRASRSTDIDPTELASAIAAANVPTLLAVLLQLTADPKWMTERHTPSPLRGLVDDESGGLTADAAEEVRAAVLQAALRWHRGEVTATTPSAPPTLLDIMSFTTGKDTSGVYAEIFAEALSLESVALGQTVEEAAKSGVSAIIVGAGLSGLMVATQFAQKGIPFRIVEKNADVGGVWLSNVYPGAGVDTPSQLYTFSSMPFDWSTVFARQPEVLRYARAFAEKFALRPAIQFDTRVTLITFDEATDQWIVDVDGPAGHQKLRSDIVVSAVGTFAEPALPNVPGVDTFTGALVHTALWPDDVELSGKRVAVVGAGASAMQLVPRIVDEVSELVVFQRTPQWIAPVDNYFDAVPGAVDTLYATVPLYWEWFRFRLATTWNDGAYPALKVDPEWTGFPRSVNRINASQRRYYEKYLRSQLEGRPDLIEAATPDYPPFGKRLLLDNGWFAAIRKSNVHLVPLGVSALDATGVVDSDGAHHDADVVVFATGFTAADYLSTLPVVGRGGRQLKEAWRGDDAAAYLGMTVSGFPNLFIMYGPNIHPGPGGSYLFLAEASATYIAEAADTLKRRGGGSLEVRPSVFADYTSEVDTENRSLVWGTDVVRSYAKNSAGRVVTNYPWRISEYWMRTKHFRSEDYEWTVASRD